MHPVDTLSWLSKPESYREALALLREREAELVQATGRQDLSLRELPPHDDAPLARLLAESVSRGGFAFGPVQEKRAHLGGKWRLLYRAPLLDTVVLIVLARVTTHLLDSSLSSRVYSYRKGRSSQQAVRDLSRLVRQHRLERLDPKARGLHVVRRDIARYGDSIPVHEHSPLWPALSRALVAAGCPAAHPLHTLLEQALRPEVIRISGERERPERGVPMGSPLQPIICNFYLGPLDAELSAMAGGYYARFGDDLLFAHPDANTATEASRSIERHLQELDLAPNPAKSLDVFWNGAGRRPDVAFVPDEPGATHLAYLGARLSFNGGIALGVHKLRRVRRELAERLRLSSKLLVDVSPPERVRTLTAALSRALEPGGDVALALAQELWAACDDRRELRQLDYWLARSLAEQLSGRRGPRAFRSVSYRKLRAAGLVSLVARRHRARTAINGRAAEPDAGGGSAASANRKTRE